MRCASCHPTACVFRASWSGCYAATNLNSVGQPIGQQDSGAPSRGGNIPGFRSCVSVRGHVRDLGAGPSTLAQPGAMVSQLPVVTKRTVANAGDQPAAFSFAISLANVSRKPMVRVNTSLPGDASLSRQK